MRILDRTDITDLHKREEFSGLSTLVDKIIAEADWDLFSSTYSSALESNDWGNMNQLLRYILYFYLLNPQAIPEAAYTERVISGLQALTDTISLEGKLYAALVLKWVYHDESAVVTNMSHFLSRSIFQIAGAAFYQLLYPENLLGESVRNRSTYNTWLQYVIDEYQQLSFPKLVTYLMYLKIVTPDLIDAEMLKSVGFNSINEMISIYQSTTMDTYDQLQSLLALKVIAADQLEITPHGLYISNATSNSSVPAILSLEK